MGNREEIMDSKRNEARSKKNKKEEI